MNRPWRRAGLLGSRLGLCIAAGGQLACDAPPASAGASTTGSGATTGTAGPGPRPETSADTTSPGTGPGDDSTTESSVDGETTASDDTIADSSTGGGTGTDGSTGRDSGSTGDPATCTFDGSWGAHTRFGPDFVSGFGQAATGPVAASRTDGSFVVVWGADDGALWWRRFHPDASFDGEAQLLVPSNGLIARPSAVAMREDGRFVVSRSNFSDPLDLLWFDADGSLLAEDLDIAGSLGWSGVPAVAVGADGRAVAVWQGGCTQSLCGVPSYPLYMRRFDQEAGPLGPAQTILGEGTQVAVGGSVAIHPDGDIIVGWTNNNPNLRIAYQWFDADGIAAADSVTLIEYPFGPSGGGNIPDISMLPDGRHAVAWDGFGDYELAVQRFNADGSPNGPRVDVYGGSLPSGTWATPLAGRRIKVNLREDWSFAAGYEVGGLGLPTRVHFFDDNGDAVDGPLELSDSVGVPTIAGQGCAGAVAVVYESADSIFVESFIQDDATPAP